MTFLSSSLSQRWQQRRSVNIPFPLLAAALIRSTLGSNGNLWFTEPFANNFGRITLRGLVTEYPVRTPKAFPIDITSGPDGNIWFTEMFSDGSKVGKLVINTGTITEYPTPTPGSSPRGHHVCAGWQSLVRREVWQQYWEDHDERYHYRVSSAHAK